MFVAMGLSAVVRTTKRIWLRSIDNCANIQQFPVIHGLRLYGFKQMQDQIGLSWLVSQGILYIAGASIYAVSLGARDVLKMQGVVPDET